MLNSLLANQKVVVIGASSGIGLALAQAVAEAGGEVVLSSRSPEKLNQLASAIGEQAKAIPVDITNEKSVQQLFEQVGSFEHLVVTTKASVPSALLFDITTEAVWQTFNGKFLGPLYAAKHGVPHLKLGGSITFFSGVVAWKPSKGTSIQAAVNSAIAIFAQTMALELAPIRVNTISPGITNTPSWAGMPEEKRATFFESTANKLPVQRIGQPRDLVQAVLFLITNGFVTGQVIHVDGGAQLV